MARQKSVSGAWCSVPKEVSRGVFLTSVFWFVFLATAKNEQETQSKAQIIRNCYYSEKTKNKRCIVLKNSKDLQEQIPVIAEKKLSQLLLVCACILAVSITNLTGNSNCKQRLDLVDKLVSWWALSGRYLYGRGCRTNFNFILKCHCTDDFSRQELRCFATAKVVGTRQAKNLSCTHGRTA